MRLIDADVLIGHFEKLKKESASLVDMAHIIGFQSVIDAQPTAYDLDKVVEQLENINTAWNCQECVHLKVCDEIQMEKGAGSEHIDLYAEVVKTLAAEIAKGGGADAD